MTLIPKAEYCGLNELKTMKRPSLSNIGLLILFVINSPFPRSKSTMPSWLFSSAELTKLSKFCGNETNCCYTWNRGNKKWRSFIEYSWKGSCIWHFDGFQQEFVFKSGFWRYMLHFGGCVCVKLSTGLTLCFLELRIRWNTFRIRWKNAILNLTGGSGDPPVTFRWMFSYFSATKHV